MVVATYLRQARTSQLRWLAPAEGEQFDLSERVDSSELQKLWWWGKWSGWSESVKISGISQPEVGPPGFRKVPGA